MFLTNTNLIEVIKELSSDHIPIVGHLNHESSQLVRKSQLLLRIACNEDVFSVPLSAAHWKETRKVYKLVVGAGYFPDVAHPGSTLQGRRYSASGRPTTDRHALLGSSQPD
ncbi:hypothetical protein PR048_010784 [Dryococelus australis]|uniref:Uncharacterized protein n=1 Tax=Dryococelus australis TaxID=614101 RepID=A0ABQ9I3P3_9NEOP|nr:hypothetical protein PR048_010784 [Dryococelus australis]